MIEKFWKKFIVKNNIKSCEYEAWSFGMEADLLSKLVSYGEKTATSSAYPLYKLKNKPLPKVGNYNIILNSKGKPVCITQTKKVYIKKFCEVTIEHAYKEGEGDKSLEFWRSVHENYFTKCLEEVGLNFTLDMKVVCEEFEVVYKR